MKNTIKKFAVALITAMVVSGGMVFGADEVGKKPSDYLTLKIDSNAKTGGFVGGELGLIAAEFYSPYNYANTKGNTTLLENPPGLAINIIGGYQWYFYNKPYFHLGVRAKGWLGYGYHTHKDKNDYENYYQNVDHLFNFGSDVAFLWDFLNSDSHSFGVHFAPIGFNVTVEYFIQDNYKRGNVAYKKDDRSGTNVYGSYTINLGLHYYYNVNHQFSVDYRHFANSFSVSSADQTAERQNWQTKIKHQFTVGYSYKF